jgi:hypothetical protein
VRAKGGYEDRSDTDRRGGDVHRTGFGRSCETNRAMSSVHLPSAADKRDAVLIARWSEVRLPAMRRGTREGE